MIPSINQKSSIEAQSNSVKLNNLITAEITKPGRYIGHELGIQTKDWNSAKTRWALTYPDLYEVGASNLGHIILYSILNAIPGQLCDRAYLPGDDFRQRLRDSSQNLFAVESQKPLSSFDILGFSLSYELGATNILEMLDLAGISIYSDQRRNLPINHKESTPLIFAGGPTATSNPEPFAAFFDFIALGDGEELLPEIGLIIAEAKTNKLTRKETLSDLAEIPGVYVPSLFKASKNGMSIEPKDSSLPSSLIRRVANPIPFYGMGLVPNIETVHDRLTIEIRRGCTRGCRFCQPGMLTRPARDVKPKEIIKTVEEGMEKTGYSDFSLLSLSCSDYLALPAVGVELRNKLSKKNVTLQLPSQRIDRFNDDIAHIVGGVRKTSLTFAPEAGTQKLRDVINKGLTDEDLLNGIRKAMENGHRKVKLYFMIGLPGEDDNDVIGIASTCTSIRNKCKDLGKLNLNLTISNFTPKPHTPFQWHSVSNEELKRKQKLLKDSFSSSKGIKVNFTDVRLSAMEDFIGRGSRNLAQVIEAAWKEGAGMDAWFESLDRTHLAWKKAINLFGLEGKYRDIEMGSWERISSLNKENLMELCSLPLPWDHIDTGISKEWLAKDLQRALEKKVVEDCSFNQCSSCGVCGEEMGHNEIIEPLPIPQREPYLPPESKIGCRIRIKFSKKGYLIYLGHLDILRLLERALRRSSLPISYSGGFHPLPRIKFALALPLGIEAEGEIMDIDFTKELDPYFIIIKLQEFLPKELKLLSATLLKPEDYNLSGNLKSAVWSFNLTPLNSDNLTDLELEKAINHILNRKTLIWKDKDKKGRNRLRDFKTVLSSLTIEPMSSNTSHQTSPKTLQLKLESLIEKSGLSLKPRQIHHWIEEYLNQPLKITGIKRNELLLFQC